MSRRSLSLDTPGLDHHAGLLSQHCFEYREPLMARALDDHDIALVNADDVGPIDRVGQRLEQRELFGRATIAHLVQLCTGEDLHVLAVAAPQTDLALAGHVGVAVDAEPCADFEDLVDRHTLALAHTELAPSPP